MFAPGINLHEGAFRHMAVHALGSLAPLWVAVVLWRVKITGVVALRAHGIALRFQLAAVGVVAIAADHAGLEHPALFKGAEHKHFFPDTAIGVVERLVQAAQAELIMDLTTALVGEAGSQ